MKLQDMVDCVGIPSESLPPGMQESPPVVEDFDISVAGILKLLKLPARTDSNQSC